MLEYRVAGLTAASAATADHGVAILWNPSTTKPLWIVEIDFAANTAAAGAVTLTRTTSRGTPGTTVTPDIDNHVDHLLAPPSGALLDLATYSAQPALSAPDLGWYQTAATIGAGKIWNLRAAPIRLLPGEGCGLINAAAVAVAASPVEFCWAE